MSQSAFDHAHQGPADLLTMMIAIDVQPIYLGADRTVPLEQQQANSLPADPGDPCLQNLGPFGVVSVGVLLSEPLRQARRQAFDDLAADLRIFSSAMETSMPAR